MAYDLVTKSVRNESLDIARGLGMILVLYGHILQILFHKRLDGGFSNIAFAQWQAIYGFHMPLFFLISGAIVDQFANKSWKQVVSRSLYFILIAYIVDVIGILLVLTQPGAPAVSTFKIEEYLVNHVLLAESFSTITLWFLVAFAIVRLAAYAMLRYEGFVRWLFAVLLVLGFALSYTWPNAFHIRAVAPGVAFFMLGRYLALRSLNLKPLMAFSLLAISLWTAHYNDGCTFGWQQTCENAELPGHFAVLMIFGLYGNLGVFFIAAITGSLAVMSLASLLVQTRLSAILCFIGKHSLDLLIINGFCLVFANPVLRDRVDINETIAFYVALATLTILAHIAVLFFVKPLLSIIHRTADGLARLIVDLFWLPWVWFQTNTVDTKT